MKKVLLVYDDFNEMTLLQSTLKKLGFDVVGISNEYLLSQQMLEFAPEVIVVAGNNTKVSSLSVSAKLKENKKYIGNVLVILPSKLKLTSQDLLKMRMDLVLEAPVTHEALIQGLAQLMDQSDTNLLEKLRKFTAAQQPKEGKSTERSTDHRSFSDPGQLEKKISRYQKLTQEIAFDSGQTLHGKAAVREKQKELAKGWDIAELEAQDKLRKEFASALFDGLETEGLRAESADSKVAKTKK